MNDLFELKVPNPEGGTLPGFSLFVRFFIIMLYQIMRYSVTWTTAGVVSAFKA